MTKYLASFHDADTNMTALVFVSGNKAGGFGVALRDDDSGEMVSPTFHGFKTIEAATAKAQAVLA